jgi:hypothetical protein
LGDACDSCPNDADNDIDGDGVCGDVDNCPNVANAGQNDGDADGVGDACDACPNDANNDIDGDGVCAEVDNCPTVANPGQSDSDADNLGDACDACPSDPNNNSNGNDEDGDGVSDTCDVCPKDPDNDADADGLCGDVDNCPLIPNSGQTDSDGDQRGDVCDNCVVGFNPSQSDFDADAEGDRCDLDDGLIYIYFDGPARVQWEEELGFSEWNSYRGDLDVLKSDGTYTQDPQLVPLAAQTCNSSDPWVDDLVALSAGQAVFFLNTGVSGSTESGLGTDGDGSLRPNENACP